MSRGFVTTWFAMYAMALSICGSWASIATGNDSLVGISGKWVLHDSDYQSTSPFASYRSRLIDISGADWSEVDLLGVSHKRKSYRASLEGEKVTLVDATGRQRVRYLNADPRLLEVCWDPELTKCDRYAREDWPRLVEGSHAKPKFKAEVTWREGSSEVVQLLTLGQSQQLLPSDYDEVTPRWTRILFPGSSSQSQVVYGVTVFTALVDRDPELISSYAVSLTLWAGIPSGSSMYILPFAKQEIARPMVDGQSVLLSGKHAQREFELQFIFNSLEH